MAEDALLSEAKEAFDLADEHESENRKRHEDDIRFALKGEQWPLEIIRQREIESRPVLTINKAKAFIRQVTNDVRQNKPAIKVHPVDDGADKETAEVLNGIIRNIEYTSNAGVAYQTGTEYAVAGNVGYWVVDIDYAHDDSFDLDIQIERVSNPLTIYGDPYSTAADSSDWMTGFQIEMLSDKQFEREYKGAEKVDWERGNYSELAAPWREDNRVMVANYWKRSEIQKTLLLLSDGTIIDEEGLRSSPVIQTMMETGALTVEAERPTRSFKVVRHTLTGAEVLKSEDWVGKYIPIIPVYGDEFFVEGERHLFSLIHEAKDAQRMHNYWRTTSTELIALAPKVPFIGPKGSFKTDAKKWAEINRVSYPFVEYDIVSGGAEPVRQPLDVGPAAGAMQEALAANDDMKAIMGMYDASLGARSNETSGRAILARQREGDVSTFHFIDNMARAIRHTGRVVLDLIPHVYTKPRIARIIGEDGKQDSVQVNQPIPVMNPETGQPMANPETGEVMTRIHDLTKGKYDLTVSTGPSFTTRREEAATQMTELVRAFPAAAPVVAPHLAKNLDWPGADDLAEGFEKMARGGMSGEAQKKVQQMVQENATLKQENARLKGDMSLEQKKLAIDEYEAVTDRMKVEGELGAKAAELSRPVAI